MAEQFKVAVPFEQRVNGWLYDSSSGLCMGLASDELKKKQPPNVPFKMALFGCPYELVIHQSTDWSSEGKSGVRAIQGEIVTDPAAIFEWCYSRKKGDIEVFAPTEAEAKRLVIETGMVKNFDAKKLKKTDSCLSDRLKKESIK